MQSTGDTAPLRRMIYVLLIVLAAGAVAGRILAVARVYEPYLSRDENEPGDRRGLWPRTRPEPMPTLGDNDRSRWDTVRALVDEGTYAIGHRDRAIVAPSALALLAAADGMQMTILSAAGYQVRVRSDRGILTEDGWKTIDKVLRPDTFDFYSSKPPLLPTLVAGEYWLLKQILSWSITMQRWSVVRVILLTVNWFPFVLFLWLLSRLLDHLGTTNWGRLYVLGAACFGTLLTPFAITLNNHSVAACAALFALYAALRIWSGSRSWLLSAGAGFFAGFTATNELPAASFVVLLFLVLLFRSPWCTLLCYAPAAALPIAAHFLTNYIAIGQWAPAYENFGGPWYEFEGSYWRIEPDQIKHGIDWAYQTESRAMYAFHVLVGHHGFFSLSPIYLLAMAGAVYGLLSRKESDDGRISSLKIVAFLTLVLTVVIVGFYTVVVADRNRNYGGWTSGLRWLMWLTPLWLLSILPAADWLAARRWGRGLAYVLLAISVFSASYPAWNPWRHPWLYNFLEARGWVLY
jgi:hypothetical protein